MICALTGTLGGSEAGTLVVPKAAILVVGGEAGVLLGVLLLLVKGEGPPTWNSPALRAWL